MRQNPFVFLVSRAWRHAEGHRKKMASYYALLFCSVMIILLEPYLIGRMLNDFQKGDFTLGTLSTYLGIYFCLPLCSWAFHGPGRLLELDVAFFARSSFRQKLFDSLMGLSVNWHRDNLSGDSVDKVTKGALSLHQFMSSKFEVIYMITRFIGAQIILICFMPVAGLVVALTVLVTGACVLFFDKRLSRQYDELNAFDNRVASAIFDYVNNVVTVITLRLESKVSRHVASRMKEALSLTRGNTRLNELKWLLSTTMLHGMVVVVLWVYSYSELVSGRTLMVGTFFTLFQYLRAICHEFDMFTYKYGVLVRQASEIHAAESILEAHEKEGRRAEAALIPNNWCSVEIEGLSFTYEDETHRTHHLEDISLSLEAGTSVALVGPSGCGKSTLLRLLRGLHTPTRGGLRCDAIPLGEKGFGALASHATLIPQDPEIFADSIRFNITLGIDAPPEEIEAAIRLAQFQSVLSRLPRGLDTHIAEKGVNLSGGEKQRLALARGLFFAKESRIILLDEPTSSVDVKNERTIYSNILAVKSEGRCIVSSIHKLHLLEMFDLIYIFHEGRIVEMGGFEELMEKRGTLFEMIESNMKMVA